MISVAEATEKILATVDPLPPELIELKFAGNRILADDIRADVDSPPHRKSLMDGYAVRSADLRDQPTRLRVVETIVAGGWPQRALSCNEAARIMTGAAVPDGADAVVMIEATKQETSPEGTYVIIDADPVTPGKNLMQRADNFAVRDIVLPVGHRVRPWDLGLLAEVGSKKFLVGTRPRVAVLATGDELVAHTETPSRGQIRNSNGPLLISLLQSLGLTVADLGIAQDQELVLEKSIEAGLQFDVLIITGGVSEGLMDLVPATLRRLGVTEVFHKVNVKPGKPIWYGVYRLNGRCCYVFGLPGNPISSLAGVQLFVRTAIRKMECDPNPALKRELVELTESHSLRGSRPTFWPGRYRVSNSTTRQVQPLLWRGSSDLLALGSADGMLFFDALKSEYPPGSVLEFLPFHD